MPLISERVTTIIANPVQTREDLERLLYDLLRPLIDAQSEGCARIRLGSAVVGYDSTAAELEGFSRAFWGIAPFFAAIKSQELPTHWEDVRCRWVTGLENGVDPGHEDYWGECGNSDQRLVEQAGMALAILIAPRAFWEPLSPKTKARLAAWLLQGDTLVHPRTNWRLLVNLALKQVDGRYSQEVIDNELEVTETFIGPDNLPSDGPHGESPSYDYYATSFAIPFYGIIFSKHCPDHPLAEEWRQRARKLAPRVVHLFAPNGAAIPFGRSMIYRFACVAFWSAVAYAEIELPAPFSLGVIKGIILRHIRWFTKNPEIFHRDGSLCVGWAYPTCYISEEYTSPQGPYWALKSFLILALPFDHIFWSTPEEAYPSSVQTETYSVPSWRQTLTHAAGHTFLLNSGQMSYKPQRNDAAKYSKLAYSASFGSSLPTDPTTLRGMGADSTLLVSLDGEKWIARRECDAQILENDVIRSVWRPTDHVKIETWLIPPEEGSAYHTRIHRVDTSVTLQTFESGFAIDNTTSETRPARPLIKPSEHSITSGKHGRWEDVAFALVHSIAGVSGIINPLTSSRPERAEISGVVQDMDAGSNLMSPRTIVPALRGTSKAGTSWFASRVFAIPIDSPAYESWGGLFRSANEDTHDTVRDLAKALGVDIGEDH